MNDLFLFHSNLYYNRLMDYWRKANEELHYAQQAREFENEGMARVCARRAAGWAIKGYLHDHKLPIPTPTAMDLLQSESIQSQFPDNIRKLIMHLTQRVSLENGMNGIDLLEDTNNLIIYLHNSKSIEE
jgi:hypothetical protein